MIFFCDNDISRSDDLDRRFSRFQKILRFHCYSIRSEWSLSRIEVSGEKERKKLFFFPGEERTTFSGSALLER